MFQIWSHEKSIWVVCKCDSERNFHCSTGNWVWRLFGTPVWHVVTFDLWVVDLNKLFLCIVLWNYFICAYFQILTNPFVPFSRSIPFPEIVLSLCLPVLLFPVHVFWHSPNFPCYLSCAQILYLFSPYDKNLYPKFQSFMCPFVQFSKLKQSPVYCFLTCLFAGKIKLASSEVNIFWLWIFHKLKICRLQVHVRENRCAEFWDPVRCFL